MRGRTVGQPAVRSLDGQVVPPWARLFAFCVPRIFVLHTDVW
jgi:hypothetical protein